ncbi:hypothetical protein [Kocuria rosea]|uniref:hypothetical protein n=1 Tax=Kocuria rosea TaxID=1275 RepID=UPI00232DF2BE|nr:hypothetical protein [Kocuria rosea]
MADSDAPRRHRAAEIPSEGAVDQDVALDVFKELSLVELHDFVKQFEDTFDVTAVPRVDESRWGIAVVEPSTHPRQAGSSNSRMSVYRKIVGDLAARKRALLDEEDAVVTASDLAKKASADASREEIDSFIEQFHETWQQRAEELASQIVETTGRVSIGAPVADMDEKRVVEDGLGEGTKVDGMADNADPKDSSGVGQKPVDVPRKSGKRYKVHLHSRGKIVYVESLARKRFLEAADRLATPLR